MTNNLKTAQIHNVFCIIYAVFIGMTAITGYISRNSRGNQESIFIDIAIYSILILLFLIHLALEVGAKIASPTARKLSKYIAILMLFGIPVGTIAGLYLLSTLDDWPEPKVLLENSKSEE